MSPNVPEMEMEGPYDSERHDLRYLSMTAVSGETYGRRRRLCLCDVFPALMNADFQLGLVLAPPPHVAPAQSHGRVGEEGGRSLR